MRELDGMLKQAGERHARRQPEHVNEDDHQRQHRDLDVASTRRESMASVVPANTAAMAK